MWALVYAFGFLSALYLDQFLWLVYLLHLGDGPVFIGLQCALMQAGRLALDLPSSMFADHFGGRAVLVAGSLAKFLAAVPLLLAGNGPGYVLAGSLVIAISFALPSGVDLAYVCSLSERVGCAILYTAVRWSAATIVARRGTEVAKRGGL